MDAHHLQDDLAGLIRPLSISLSPSVGLWLGGGIAAALLLVGLTLLVRGAAGAFDAPLPTLLLLATGLAAVLAAVAARFAWRFARVPVGDRRPMALHVSLSAGLLLLGAGVTLPGGTVAALLLFWTLLLAEEAAAWRGILRRQSLPGVAARTVRTASPSAKSTEEESWQQVTRGRSADGRQTAHGWLRAEFAAGQRTAVAHVAICPPLPNVPGVTFRQTAGPEARVKAAQVLPYGIRFEIKLPTASERARQVRIEFTAEGSPSRCGPLP